MVTKGTEEGERSMEKKRDGKQSERWGWEEGEGGVAEGERRSLWKGEVGIIARGERLGSGRGEEGVKVVVNGCGGTDENRGETERGGARQKNGGVREWQSIEGA